MSVYEQGDEEYSMRVLIAGGGSGLGLELYKSFCRNWSLDGLGTFSRNVDFLAFDKFKNPIIRKPNLPLVASVDATDVEAVDEYVSSYEYEFGTVTHLVCTLGVYGPLEHFNDCDIDEWMAGIENSLFGPAIVAKRVIPGMIAADYGKIVFLSGGGATRPIKGATSYCAAKTGLVRFAETLAHELHPYHIDVNCVAPGLMPTRFIDQAIAAGNGGNVAEDLYAEAAAMNLRENKEESFIDPIACIQNLLLTTMDGITGNLISARYDSVFDIPKGLTTNYSLARVK